MSELPSYPVETYPVTDEMREKYPKEAAKWEKLLEDAAKPECRGCLTCELYAPLPEEYFADVENVGDEDKDWLPWDTENAWVYCDLDKNDTLLKTECDDWQEIKDDRS